MYLNILKKDLKRKRAMNVILLVFITLSTMFISSSVNNIFSVTTALDSYFEMADVPNYFAVAMNTYASAENLTEVLKMHRLPTRFASKRSSICSRQIILCITKNRSKLPPTSTSYRATETLRSIIS